jgi:hypothetical protein
VGRKKVREQIIAATKLSLTSGERIRSCSAVWATECGGRVPLLFRRRSRHYVAVTDQRLILFGAPGRRQPLTPQQRLIAKRLASFTLVKTIRRAPLLQLRVRDAGGREIALEFRPRDRKVGNDLASVLARRPRDFAGTDER